MSIKKIQGKDFFLPLLFLQVTFENGTLFEKAIKKGFSIDLIHFL